MRFNSIPIRPTVSTELEHANGGAFRTLHDSHVGKTTTHMTPRVLEHGTKGSTTGALLNPNDLDAFVLGQPLVYLVLENLLILTCPRLEEPTAALAHPVNATCPRSPCMRSRCASEIPPIPGQVSRGGLHHASGASAFR